MKQCSCSRCRDAVVLIACAVLARVSLTPSLSHASMAALPIRLRESARLESWKVDRRARARVRVRVRCSMRFARGSRLPPHEVPMPGRQYRECTLNQSINLLERNRSIPDATLVLHKFS